jgi:hypothetical protein
MTLICALLGVVTAQAGLAQTRAGSDTAAGPDAVCVRNATSEPFLFAAQAPGGARLLATLAPGEMLCSTGSGKGAGTGTGTGRGVVSVYAGADVLEGCSRLVAPGRIETLLRYADFDRCAWTSNS